MIYTEVTTLPEAREDNHYSKLFSNRSPSKDDKKIEFTIAGNESSNPIFFKVEDKEVWIKEAEYNKLQEHNIRLESISNIWYIPGSISPFKQHSGDSYLKIDGYLVAILYKQ